MIRRIFRIFLFAVCVALMHAAAYAQPETAVQANAAGSSSSENAPDVYEDQGRRDPLWPLVTTSGMIINYDKDLFASDLTLEGIMLEPGGNLAIINGMIVGEEDTIGMYVVQKIEPNAVILLRGDESVTLKLKKEE